MLVASEGEDEGERGVPSAENAALLREQNAALAAEPTWAHATPFAENGGILLRSESARAMEDNPQVRPRTATAASRGNVEGRMLAAAVRTASGGR